MPLPVAARPVETRHAQAWAAVGLGVAAFAALHGELLLAGGLAPLVVAAAVALAVGVPAAVVELRAPRTPADDPLIRVLLAAVGGAALARGVLPPDRASGLDALAVVASLGAAAVAARAAQGPDPRRARLAVRLLARLVVVGALLAAVLPLVAAAVSDHPLAPGWSALRPAWAAWSDWLAPALVLGLLLPAAGAHLWRAPDVPTSGTSRLPALAGGAALLLAVAGTWGDAAAVEVTTLARLERAAPPHSPLLALALGAGLAAAAPDGRRLRLLAELVAWTAWFALAGRAATVWTWAILVPLALLWRTAGLALSRHGTERLVAGTAALVALAALGLGFPGVPDDVGQAAGAAATVVLAVWLVGLHRVREVA